jgi:peptide/nickel transport system permease protein
MSGFRGPKHPRLFSRAARTPALAAGLGMLALLLCCAGLIPRVSGYSPSGQNLYEILRDPSAEHWLGTDQLGRDIFVRLFAAAAVDLKIMALAELFPFILGVSLGLIAGYCGGWADWLILRLTDTVIAFPFYIIVTVVAFAAGAGERGIYLTFAVVGWVVFARVVRGAALQLKRQEWVAAAKILGYPPGRIIFRHLLPNVLPQAVVLLMNNMVTLLVAIVTLGYLGIGIKPPLPDWGTMISDGQAFITTKWRLAAYPGCAVVYTGIALSLIGDGLADVWRLK